MYGFIRLAIYLQINKVINKYFLTIEALLKTPRKEKLKYLLYEN